MRPNLPSLSKNRYSARFHGRTRSNLVLASGTVFNQVLIWDATSPNEHDGESVVRRRLIGHEGVIFGIRFNEEGKMIASVSDDRTIRVWKLDEDDR
ncbi:hypothetical protein BC938DRAFT_478404 [Jimgerdemannia flammicorona]|uniref:Uncharacterized protein n=1 Tax=Jimgerdemannia flammicorona TaxID=994334 RepID=A0A433QMX2_9FUNG|nr:hypothetical protein BC938DRAFT_478404 [Jimgerdemannia flammicorona]